MLVLAMVVVAVVLYILLDVLCCLRCFMYALCNAAVGGVRAFDVAILVMMVS